MIGISCKLVEEKCGLCGKTLWQGFTMCDDEEKLFGKNYWDKYKFKWNKTKTKQYIEIDKDFLNSLSEIKRKLFLNHLHHSEQLYCDECSFENPELKPLKKWMSVNNYRGMNGRKRRIWNACRGDEKQVKVSKKDVEKLHENERRK